MTKTVPYAIIAILLIVVGIGSFYAGMLYGSMKTTTVTKTTTSTKSPAEHTKTTSPATTTAAKTVTLKVIGGWGGKEKEYILKVFEAFEKEHPNIKIEYIQMRAEDLRPILPSELAAGVSPGDVISVPWGWFIVDLAKKGYLVDLTPYINPNDYVTGVLDPVTWNHKIWAAPFTMWLKPGFWYRKSFFEKYGLKPPETWDDFIKLLNKLKTIPGVKAPIVSGDSKGWPLSDIAEAFIIRFGGPQLQYDLISGKVRFDSSEVKAIFHKLADMIKKGYFSEPIDWTQAIPLWWKGEYGLYFMGTWIAGMVPDPNDLGFFPMPGTKGIVGGADYWFIPKASKHREAAIELVKWLATEGQVIHASLPSGKLPTWKGAPVNKIWGPMREVYNAIKKYGLKILPDLDDSVGGDWQALFWDQLKLLWTEPNKVDQILKTLADNFPYKK